MRDLRNGVIGAVGSAALWRSCCGSVFVSETVEGIRIRSYRLLTVYLVVRL